MTQPDEDSPTLELELESLNDEMPAEEQEDNIDTMKELMNSKKKLIIQKELSSQSKRVPGDDRRYSLGYFEA